MIETNFEYFSTCLYVLFLLNVYIKYFILVYQNFAVKSTVVPLVLKSLLLFFRHILQLAHHSLIHKECQR
jgi:hypothetical protein